MNKNKLGTTFEEFLEEELKDPGFRKVWEASEADYQIARQMIKARLEKKIKQGFVNWKGKMPTQASPRSSA